MALAILHMPKYLNSCDVIELVVLCPIGKCSQNVLSCCPTVTK